MAGEMPEYLAFVREHPCRMSMNDPCEGYVQAHHAGPRGLGQRAHDDTAIPLCDKHHRAWHDCNPPFRGWSKLERIQWSSRQIDRMRRIWDEEHGQ